MTRQFHQPAWLAVDGPSITAWSSRDTLPPGDVERGATASDSRGGMYRHVRID